MVRSVPGFGQGVALLLAAYCVAGCTAVSLQIEDAAQTPANRVLPPEWQKELAVEAGKEGRQVACMDRPIEATPRRPDSSTIDAGLLAYGLYDMCVAYRDGQVTRAQYALALEHCAPLVVQLAGYRALGGLPEGSLSAEAQHVEMLIAENPALAALCRSPSFRARLANPSAAISGGDLARWCCPTAAQAAGEVICAYGPKTRSRSSEHYQTA